MTHNAEGITETAVPVFPSSTCPIALIKLWTWGLVIKGCPKETYLLASDSIG
jgi:hypothetical protein